MEITITVHDFIAALNNETQRNDSLKLIAIIEQLTGLEAKMWGKSIIGFGQYHYRYDSGHEGESHLVGFSPRATALTLYLSAAIEQAEDLLKNLGKHKAGKGCIYVKKLDDIDIEVLKSIITIHVEFVRKQSILSNIP